MFNEKRRRPLLVWLISIVVGLMAVTQLLIQLLPIFTGPSTTIMSDLRDAVASLPAFDRASMFLLSAALLTSMVLFFRMKKISVQWFVVHLVLGIAAVLRYVAEPEAAPSWFNGNASLIGITAAALILAYMWGLKRRQALA